MSDAMKSDLIKLMFTYGIAAVVIIGGLFMLYETRLDPPESDVQGLRLLLSGFIGGAMTFVFARESATQATRAAESAHKQGADQTQHATDTANG